MRQLLSNYWTETIELTIADWRITLCEASIRLFFIKMWSFLHLFGSAKRAEQQTTYNMIKYLVVGLGNIGPEYCKTRHNTGFMVVDRFAEKNNAPAWEDRRYGFINRVNIKGRQIVLLKPSTFMNLSGNAVRYWMKEENIALENLLIVVDDLALPLGELRRKPKGSDAGHNGLKHIADILGTQSYARLRFGIGNEYPRGGQVDFVLGKFDDEDLSFLSERIDIACEMIKSFCLAGITTTMNQFNKK